MCKGKLYKWFALLIKIISKNPETFSVNLTACLFCIAIVILLTTACVSQVFAVQLTAVLIPSRDTAAPLFSGVRFITIKYDPNSPISKLLNGKSQHVTFEVKGPGGGMPGINSAFNQAIATQKQSPVRILNANLSYSADLTGQPDNAILSYKVDFKPIITRYVLEKNSSQGTVLDTDWRSISVNGPLIADTPKYGKINVNYPIGLLQVLYPAMAQQILNSQAAKIMTTPLLNFDPLAIPLDRWHFLFDPTGSVAGAASFGFSEQGGARAVSIYSLGESSFREGTFSEQTADSPATIDGTQVNVHASTPPPSAQLQIVGFSKIQKSGNNELAFVSTQAPSGTVTATGGFPLQVLLVLGGMMGAVAVFVLVKARK